MAIVHKFESAGLGIAPFRFTGIERKMFSIPGMPEATKPGGTCQYCGTCIVECCWITDANGKKFYVGNECVRKTGDTGLYDTVATALRRLRSEARAAKLKAQRIEATALLAHPEVVKVLTAKPHPNSYYTAQGKTMLDYYAFMIDRVNSAVPMQLKSLREIARTEIK